MFRPRGALIAVPTVVPTAASALFLRLVVDPRMMPGSESRKLPMAEPSMVMVIEGLRLTRLWESRKACFSRAWRGVGVHSRIRIVVKPSSLMDGWP